MKYMLEKTLIEAAAKGTAELEINVIKKKISEIDLSIMNVLSSIEKGQQDSTLEILYKRMAELADEKQNFNKKLLEMKNIDKITGVNNFNVDLVVKGLNNINDIAWDQMDVEAKRNMIKSVVEKILWDGKKIDMLLYENEISEFADLKSPKLHHEETLPKMFPQCGNSK